MVVFFTGGGGGGATAPLATPPPPLATAMVIDVDGASHLKWQMMLCSTSADGLISKLTGKRFEKIVRSLQNRKRHVAESQRFPAQNMP